MAKILSVLDKFIYLGDNSNQNDIDDGYIKHIVDKYREDVPIILRKVNRCVNRFRLTS